MRNTQTILLVLLVIAIAALVVLAQVLTGNRSLIAFGKPFTALGGIPLYTLGKSRSFDLT
jgi:hypothetical protein